MKLDVLCFAAHPDDVELAMSGTVILHARKGKRIGIVDLTRGELGSRGTAETRAAESEKASNIMGVEIRENLGLADGFFRNDQESQLKVVQMIRKYRPDILFCNAPADRHPDHGRASELVTRSCFLAGLIKVETEMDGVVQEKWRPKRVFHYIQDEYLEPDFVIDVSDVFEERRKAIMAYETQFYKSGMTGDMTPISTPEFLEFLTARMAEYGRKIGVRYGEGFVSKTPLSIPDISVLY